MPTAVGKKMEMPESREETLSRVMEILGVTKRRGWALNDVVRKIHAGLPYKSLENVSAALDLDDKAIADLLGTSTRTIARRKKEKKLSPDESDRLVRLARILELAEEVFEDRENAREWLRDPNPALNMETPLGLLDTDIGARRVEEILMRIEYGVYS